MHRERRIAARESVALPIRLGDGTTAVTRDLSAEGLYVHLPPGVRLDQWTSIEYSVPGSAVRFTARAEVVRTETTPQGTGVALRFHSPRLLPID